MSTTVAVRNYGLSPFALKGFTTLAADPTVTKTKVVKQVNHDDNSKNYDSVAKFGVVITEDGTPRPGSATFTGTDTIDPGEQVAVVNMTADMTLTLPTLVGRPAEYAQVVYLATAAAGTLTIEGAGSETINGNLNTTLTVAGTFIRIQKETETNWVTQTA